MQRVFKLIKIGSLLLGLLLLLSIPIIGIGSTVLHWNGICESETGPVACPWWQYAGGEMFWGMFVFIPFLFGAALLWLAMALVEFVAAQVKRLRARKDDAGV